jgi:hypothetical protein
MSRPQSRLLWRRNKYFSLSWIKHHFVSHFIGCFIQFYSTDDSRWDNKLKEVRRWNVIWTSSNIIRFILDDQYKVVFGSTVYINSHVLLRFKTYIFIAYISLHVQRKLNTRRTYICTITTPTDLLAVYYILLRFGLIQTLISKFSFITDFLPFCRI